MRNGGSPDAPTRESSSLGNEPVFFSAKRIRTCSWTLRALASGSGDGPSDGTMYAVQDVFGCRADRKQLSATATLILIRAEETDEPLEEGRKKQRSGAGCRGAARPLDDFVCSNVGCEMEISRCGGGTCGAGGWPQSTYRQDNSFSLR